MEWFHNAFHPFDIDGLAFLIREVFYMFRPWLTGLRGGRKIED